MISSSPCKDPVIEIVWNSQFKGSYFCTWISHIYDMYNTFNPFEIIHLLKPKYLKSMFDNQNFVSNLLKVYTNQKRIITNKIIWLMKDLDKMKQIITI